MLERWTAIKGAKAMLAMQSDIQMTLSFPEDLLRAEVPKGVEQGGTEYEDERRCLHFRTIIPLD